MAFTFLVEDGTGLPNATSYVSVEEADSILAPNIHEKTWPTLTTDAKERLLAWSTAILDDRTIWSGRKSNAESALRWPRSGVVDRDGIRVPDNVVPHPVKAGVTELARALAEVDRTVERPEDSLTRLRADVVELEFEDGYRLPVIPGRIGAILTGMGRVGSQPRWIIR